MNLKATIVVLTSLLLSVWLLGCVDVSSTGPTPPTINSEYRFLNAAEDAATVGITFDLGDAVSGLSFGQSNTHQTYPSGNRTATLSDGDSFPIAMTADQRATVVLLPKTGATREFVKLIERRIFDAASTGQLRVVHAGLAGTAAGGDLDVTATGADTSFVMTLSYRGQSLYAAVSVGSYTLTVTASGDTVPVATTTVDVSSSRSTSVIAGDVSAPMFINLSDN